MQTSRTTCRGRSVEFSRGRSSIARFPIRQIAEHTKSPSPLPRKQRPPPLHSASGVGKLIRREHARSVDGWLAADWQQQVSERRMTVTRVVDEWSASGRRAGVNRATATTLVLTTENTKLASSTRTSTTLRSAFRRRHPAHRRRSSAARSDRRARARHESD